MIRVLIIDDEPLARSVVREYLQNLQQAQIVQECADGFEGLKAIQQLKPDLVFLDVQMPKINGFEMLELADDPPPVIFTTAFDEYAVKAFEAHAVDYLLKPFSRERFEKAFEKFMDHRQSGRQKTATDHMLHQSSELPSAHERVVVKTGGKIRIIPVNEIEFVEAADDYVKIHSAAGSFLKNKTMTFFEQTLPGKRFVRCHRSYIINITEITRIDPYEKDSHLVILRSGARIPASKSGYAKLKVELGI